ncbi:MAG: TIGR00269 family protein [Candidatus Aenigmarchaeota archaeon]|nr:TIGR00269 family protein [Candidatus Aenigmarchaeota archaeon]
MNCSFCKQESIYFRNYEGHHYCEIHFVKNIEKRVKKTISTNKLIEKGDRIAVAHSGGKDSSNVLYLLNKIFSDNPNIELFAITIDEGIKGYRDKSVKKSESFCKKLGVKQHVFSFKKEFGFTIDQLSKKLKSGYCGSCGILKRYLLNKKARELGATKLATGHTLDDECQSIIMNVLRGDLLRFVRIGPMPLLAMHQKFVPRIKPLVLIPENESELFALVNNIPFHPKGCPYAVDNVLRGEVEEFLNNLEKCSPGIRYSLYESAHKIVTFVRKKFKTGKISTCEKCGEPSSRSVCKVCELIEKLSS